MIDRFCELVAFGASPMPISDWRDWLGDDLKPLQAAHFIREVSPATTVICDACFDPHPAEIRRDPLRGSYVGWCPIVGEFDVDELSVRLLSADLDACLRRLQKALIGCHRPIRELVAGRAWHLGIAHCEDYDWNAIFMPGVLGG